MAFRYSGVQMVARMRDAYRLKNRGFTYEQIGLLLGCSSKWARSMCSMHVTHVQYEKYYGLRG
jgi:hypothetical protein